MRSRAGRYLRFGIRWGVAALGVYVILFGLKVGDKTIVKGITWRDHAWVMGKQGERPTERVVVGNKTRDFFVVSDGKGGEELVARMRLVSEADQKYVKLKSGEQVELWGLALSGNVNRAPEVAGFLVRGEEGKGKWIGAGEVVDYRLKVPYPLVQMGVGNMLRGANPWLIGLAVVIFPVTFLVTSLRWKVLMGALGVEMGLGRVFVLNMVGAFWNTFLPGSTGGDLMKAYEVAKQTHHKTRAVMSVLVDRVIGLVTLVTLGGTMAGLRYWATRDVPDPATRACRTVAAGSALIVAGMGFGLWVLFHPVARRRLGVDWVLSKLPVQQKVKDVVETVEVYRNRPGLVLWALVVSLPVHVTTVVSAMLCGMAFGLKLTPGYYFVVVPVVVLVGSVPISPQGAGVMEFFAILLLARQGGTVGQAFALTMSIRMVQVLWNMTGGVFVLKGGFHAPTEKEMEEVEETEEMAGGINLE